MSDNTRSAPPPNPPITKTILLRSADFKITLCLCEDSDAYSLPRTSRGSIHVFGRPRDSYQGRGDKRNNSAILLAR